MEAEAQSTEIFGYHVSDLQGSDVVVDNSANTITGTLKYVSTGSLVPTWGEGYFLALKFVDIPEDATSVLVGLDPSEGSGLVEVINDPDKNGTFKITDKSVQVAKVVTVTPAGTQTKTYDLSGLTLEGQSDDDPDTYTEAELQGMTKSEIVALATSLGYTVNASDTKADMITSFLSQQG
jgi:hypothetical protein